MKELEPCPMCFIDEAGFERQIWYTNDWGGCFHKLIIKCPNCGFEMRRNGKKHRQEIINKWNNLFKENFDKA